MRETVTLSRSVPVVMIPEGTPSELKGGTDVVVMQTLGGNITVYSTDGRLYRIEAKDVDALGRAAAAPEANTAAASDAPATLEDRIWGELKTCYDPEIPVNIVDLGLVYLCEATELGESGGYRVDIRMTLTAPGCGMGQVIKDDVEKKIRALPEVKETYVELVFDPTWDQSMMSEAARLQLGML